MRQRSDTLLNNQQVGSVSPEEFQYFHTPNKDMRERTQLSESTAYRVAVGKHTRMLIAKAQHRLPAGFHLLLGFL